MRAQMSKHNVSHEKGFNTSFITLISTEEDGPQKVALYSVSACPP